MTTLEQVKELHEKFNCPVAEKTAWHPKTTVGYDTIKLRLNLLQEELDELETSLYNFSEEGDTQACDVEVLDALCDLQVVLDGAFLALGFWRVKDEAMAEVHRSNMSKLGADGKPVLREDGKFLKGPNYSPPNLKPIVEKLYVTQNP